MGLAAFHSIQKAFYADVGSMPILAGIAVELGMDAERFLESWHAVDAIDETGRVISLTHSRIPAARGDIPNSGEMACGPSELMKG